MSRNQQYWAFRIHTRNVAAIEKELLQGRLRQGWGSVPGQDLRNMMVDDGARRNRRMYEQVKKGDRLLIPHLPHYGQITVAEATQDWNEGYIFSPLEGFNEYGHIFPAKRLTNFARTNRHVPAALRDTFRNPSRFWNVTNLAGEIDEIIKRSPVELESTSSVVDRWKEKIAQLVQESALDDKMYNAARGYTSKSDWEFLLVAALQALNPQWEVKRTGGRAEVEHGTDILATMPDIFARDTYGVAIQVKDFEDKVGTAPLEQIRKATEFWKSRHIRILDRVLILLNCDRVGNEEIQEAAAKHPEVRIIWGPDVHKLVSRSAFQLLSDAEFTPVAVPGLT
jgi:hypothetical protein